MDNRVNMCRKVFSSLFLFIYLSFVVVEIFHHHHYDINNPQNFNTDSNQVPLTGFDLADEYSPCLLNSFSCAILNYSFPSFGIIKPLRESYQIFFIGNLDFYCRVYLDNQLLRAPPTIS
jgi:hypothetical protein